MHGHDSVKLGQAYYLLSQFYDEQSRILDSTDEQKQDPHGAQSQHESKYLMFQKAEMCLKKACELYKRHLGPTHRTVGDCLYAGGVLNKHQMLLVYAEGYFKEALRVYEEGLGKKNLQCAHCL